jgi:hypothetical protein
MTNRKLKIVNRKLHISALSILYPVFCILYSKFYSLDIILNLIAKNQADFEKISLKRPPLLSHRGNRGRREEINNQ